MTEGSRAVLGDDNRKITLTVYTADHAQPLSVVELPPLAAVRLASDLTAAAARHLSRSAGPAPRKSARGGDARAAERARRDEALRQLAAMIGADMPTEQLARDLAARLGALPAGHDRDGARSDVDARDRRGRPAGAGRGPTAPYPPGWLSNSTFCLTARHHHLRRKGDSMAELTISDDLRVRIGRASAPLTPAEAFATAEKLIRAATRSIVIDATDAALVRGVMSAPAAFLRDAAE